MLEGQVQEQVLEHTSALWPAVETHACVGLSAATGAFSADSSPKASTAITSSSSRPAMLLGSSVSTSCAGVLLAGVLLAALLRLMQGARPSSWA